MTEFGLMWCNQKVIEIKALNKSKNNLKEDVCTVNHIYQPLRSGRI